MSTVTGRLIDCPYVVQCIGTFITKVNTVTSHSTHWQIDHCPYIVQCISTFLIYVILYLYFCVCVCSITCLCCCKRKCFGIPLHVLKLMSLILVQLNCPVKDDYSFFTWHLSQRWVQSPITGRLIDCPWWHFPFSFSWGRGRNWNCHRLGHHDHNSVWSRMSLKGISFVLEVFLDLCCSCMKFIVGKTLFWKFC